MRASLGSPRRGAVRAGRVIHAVAAIVGLVLCLRPGLSAAPNIGPLRVALVVDSSSAVAPMINPFRAALQIFIDNLPGTPETLEPEVTMISTGGQLRVRVPVTTDRAKLRQAAASFASDGGGNAFVDTMLEADKRFLKPSERRPIFVFLVTDNSVFRGEPRIEEYNIFVGDFMRRGGRAHALVLTGRNAGIYTDILVNLTGNTGGYYDSLLVPNSLPDKMKYAAAMVAADQP